MAYALDVTSRAAADLASLPRKVLRAVDARILALRDNPRLPGTRKLRGSERAYRIRVGDYRILYVINNARRTLTVARVLHRSVAYRR